MSKKAVQYTYSVLSPCVLDPGWVFPSFKGIGMVKAKVSDSKNEGERGVLDFDKDENCQCMISMR